MLGVVSTIILVLNKNIKREFKKIKRFDFLYLPLIILGIAFLIFGNGIGGDFILDDGRSIFPSPSTRNLTDIPNEFFKPFYPFQPSTGLYRPLTQITYIFNLSVSNNPAFFHIVNIALHAINAWLILTIVVLVFQSRKTAYLAMGIFFFMPIHVEAITYISGRADLLALFFSLLSFLLFFFKRHWLGAIMFLMAIFSKEVAIAFPLFIIFFLFAFERFNFILWFKKILPFGITSLIYVIFRYLALNTNFLSNDNGSIANPLTIASLVTRIFTSLKLLTLYVWKSFVPINISADYSYAQTQINTSPLNWGVVIGFIFVAGVFIFIFNSKTKTTSCAFGLAFFLALYLPISNFIFPIGTIMADRFIYAGSTGLAIATASVVVYLISGVGKKTKYLLFSFLILTMFMCGIKIIYRNRVWLNEEALLVSMNTDSPKSITAKYNLGVYYLVNGKIKEGAELITEANDLTELAKKELINR